MGVPVVIVSQAGVIVFQTGVIVCLRGFITGAIVDQSRVIDVGDIGSNCCCSVPK